MEYLVEKLLKTAFGELGVKEIAGNQDHPRIIQYAKDVGIDGINDDEVPWCSTFVNWVAWKSGLSFSKKVNARSWLNVGTKTFNPKPGDVVVFWRESRESWKGHVGFFLGFTADGKQVYCLGGNQQDRVKISTYSIDKVLSYQCLAKYKDILIPEPPLKKGSDGAAVVNLQEALKSLGIAVGIVDGQFGKNTENAVKVLQGRKPGMLADGIYGAKTRDLLESLFQE